MNKNKPNKTWRSKLHEVIYEADTPAGKTFDVILLVAILASLAFVMLESVSHIDAKYHEFLFVAEWVITILFSIEYIARIITVKQPLRYIFSFYGIIDLLSTIPMYLSFFIAGSHALIALRSLRLLRVFRVLKLARYLGASNMLSMSLKASRAKIFVFLFAVLILSIIFGTLMYLIEGADSGFTSIPVSVYWCIVTLTTVGFGDIAPVTPIGQFIAAIIMIMGYGIIAVPTGIVSAEYSAQNKKDGKAEEQADHKSKPAEIQMNSQSCFNCNATEHKDKAEYCYKCGHRLHPNE
ncbi:ion transporter [Subsaximicrobium wynnwilliamsii]|jgi:voltage-gated potassium channel|uniref:Ion transporter n=1 Tax=Subsaximicrobium wynnwilliamsii TaxID=291179 RepID=A0A5C6ZNZ9_9FLAO|nr:ion transporter [Subsaximicrobium wynnwilliamsii]TXD85144.1 ion transporter [Subsaximicrobium wynnwilliamsii]TXD91187.1 ion transporter [Subsaximicrobium wynnwilliamsii]TXE04581.1 ion transporter [Subsaximicrobium wynnwilliamsii]